MVIKSTYISEKEGHNSYVIYGYGMQYPKDDIRSYWAIDILPINGTLKCIVGFKPSV